MTKKIFVALMAAVSVLTAGWANYDPWGVEPWEVIEARRYVTKVLYTCEGWDALAEDPEVGPLEPVHVWATAGDTDNAAGIAFGYWASWYGRYAESVECTGYDAAAKWWDCEGQDKEGAWYPARAIFGPVTNFGARIEYYDWCQKTYPDRDPDFWSMACTRKTDD